MNMCACKMIVIRCVRLKIMMCSVANTHTNTKVYPPDDGGGHGISTQIFFMFNFQICLHFFVIIAEKL